MKESSASAPTGALAREEARALAAYRERQARGEEAGVPHAEAVRRVFGAQAPIVGRMMIVELAFSVHADERLAARPAHREVLNRLHAEGKVVAAGPFGDDSGALLVFDADRDEVNRILAEDPYYQTPGVEVLSVREWTPVVGP